MRSGRRQCIMPPSDIPPELSVVVTAFNRRRFVKTALKSILEQSYERDRYEVILVKNFSDRDIDGFSAANGIKVVYSEEKHIGDMALGGITLARGKVVLLLDDDDVFLPGKLSRVSSVMSDGTVGYYHNGFVPFASSVPPGDGSKMSSLSMALDSTSSCTELLKAMDEGATFNSSCIAFQREIMGRGLGLIKGTPTGPGFSLMVASLVSGRRCLLSRERLTGYRFRMPKSQAAALREKIMAVGRASATVQLDLRRVTGESIRTVLRYKADELAVRLYLLGTVSSRVTAKRASLRLLSAPTCRKIPYRISLLLLVLFYPVLPHILRTRVWNLKMI